MNDQNRKSEDMDSLIDHMIDDLLATPADEIMAESDDAEEQALYARSIFEKVCEEMGPSSIQKARLAYDKYLNTRAEAAGNVDLGLFDKFMAGSSSVPEAMTLAARKGVEFSESDLEGIVEDLQELGVEVDEKD